MSSTALLADPVAVAARVAARVLAPPPPVDLTAWAVENIDFAKGQSGLPGRYNPDKFPMFRRILDVLSPDHPATVVVLAKSAQIGGTVLAQILVGGLLDLAPQPILYVHPSDENATKWKRNKFEPLVRRCDRLSALLQPEGARKGNSAMHWSRRDGSGFLQLAGANSPAQLSMESYPVAIHDDMAKWPADNGAGDPEVQADSRSKAFLKFGGKILKIGTPLIDPGCRVTAAWRSGTRERWHVPCPHCGVLQPLEWHNMLSCLDESKPEEAHFTCVACGARIEERHREWMNLKGEWKAENPTAHTLSFHLWAAYSPLESWANIARAWVKAKGNPQAEQVFLNDTVGLAWRASSAAPDWQALAERAQSAGLLRGVVPPGYYVLTIGLDCQIDRVEWQAVAWGPRGVRLVLDYGIVHHHVSTDAAWAELDALVARTFPDTTGGRRPVDQLAIDGGAWKDNVHDWARRHRQSKVIVIRGAKQDTAPPLARVKTERRPDGTVVQTDKRWFHVGVSGMKAALYAALEKDDPLSWGHVGFVAGLPDDYFVQLTSEVRKPVRGRDGATSWRWAPVSSGVAHEGLDTHLYAWAAAIRAGVASKSDEQWEALRLRWDGAPDAAGPDLFTAARPVPDRPADRAPAPAFPPAALPARPQPVTPRPADPVARPALYRGEVYL